jgi:radical SAM protein with 4Fe4S-binding SPASM domain
VYERITLVDGSFARIMRNLKILAKKGLPVLLKTNALQQNWHQMGRIKAYAEKLLERPTSHSFCFKFDTMIYPRLNGDKTPVNYRLSFEEIAKTMKTDPDFWREYKRGMHFTPSSLPQRKGTHLYHCNTWKKQFFINPYAEMKMCPFSHKYKVDLKTVSFREGFYKIFPKVLTQRFKTESKCKTCHLRQICCYCPPRAHLETGNEESPVEYYCCLAKSAARQIPFFRNAR